MYKYELFVHPITTVHEAGFLKFLSLEALLTSLQWPEIKRKTSIKYTYYENVHGEDIVNQYFKFNLNISVKTSTFKIHWWLLWYNVSKSLGNCDMRLSRYQFSPYCFISSPSCLWYDSKCDLFLNHICPYYYPYTIHTLSCYLKWRSNLKFNTPDFNIHKTRVAETTKLSIHHTKLNPWYVLNLSLKGSGGSSTSTVV